jgi:hypothetical protein
MGHWRWPATKRNNRARASPPLGWGNGGLGWRDVRTPIVEALGELPGVRVMVYPLQGAALGRSKGHDGGHDEIRGC